MNTQSSRIQGSSLVDRMGLRLRALFSRRASVVTAASATAVLAGALLVATQAKADIFEDMGLTGGGNSANILEVKGNGKLTFHKNDYDGGKPAITDFTGPQVKAEVICKRSGYRCSRLGEKSLPAKKTTETHDDVHASIAKDDTVNSTIDAACKAKKTQVQLPVTIVGQCEKVKFAIGKEHYKVSSPSKTATFELTCADYPK